MKAPIRVLCRPEVALGVALAGVTPTEVDDGAAAATVLSELGDTPASGGIILVEQVLFDALPPLLVRRIRKRGAPVLVSFPSPSLVAERRRPAEEEVLDILRRAVGYRLRLR